MDAEVLDPEQSDLGQQEDAREERRGLVWWVAVLLLLLLLSCGLLAQALFPVRRGTAGKKPLNGVTPVLSVYGLHQPLGVSSGPDGEILVSDTGVQKVLLFDRNGLFVRRIGGEKPADKIFSPMGSVWVDGSLYICDFTLRRVWVFDVQGKPIGSFPKDPMMKEFGEGGFVPYGIARFGDGLLVSARNGIYRFSLSGDFLGRFDATDGLGYEPLYMDAVAVDEASGRVYACDTVNRRVIAYDRNGKPVWVLGRRDEGGEIKSFFGLPRSVAVTERGILVSDTFRHMLVLLAPDGSVLGSYCKRGVVDGAVNFPEGLAVAPDGMVYLADRENDRIQVLRLEAPQEIEPAIREKWKQSFKKLDGR